MSEAAVGLAYLISLAGLMSLGVWFHRLVVDRLKNELKGYKCLRQAALRVCIAQQYLPPYCIAEYISDLDTKLIVNGLDPDETASEHAFVFARKRSRKPGKNAPDLVAIAAADGLAEARQACDKREQAALIVRLETAELLLRSQYQRIQDLEHLINNPHNELFLDGVRIEAAHQVERWGDVQKREKSAEAWYWLCAYLAGKALRATLTGDRKTAQHHTISTAGALLNWHDSITRNEHPTGAGADRDLARHDQP